MYKELFDALKAKFVGVSDNILGRVATKLAKTVTTAEQVKTAVDGVTLQQVIDGYADSRATEATQTAVHNYEQKYGLKDGVKVNQQPNNGGSEQQQPPVITQPQGTATETPEWVKQLLESNRTLTDRLAKLEGDRTATARKQQLDSIVSKLPETLRKPYERISLDTLTDEAFNTLVTEVTSEVDGITKDIQAKGAVFGRPSAQGGKAQQNELTKEQQEAIAHRDNAPIGSQGQPF